MVTLWAVYGLHVESKMPYRIAVAPDIATAYRIGAALPYPAWTKVWVRKVD